jgi:hypothetical protein
MPVTPSTLARLPRLALLSLLLAACGGSPAQRETTDAGESDAAATPDTATPLLDATPPPDDASDSGLPVTDSASPADAACSANTSTDPHNCGRCGHDCLGAACVAGACTPTVLVHAGQPTGIAVDSQSIYWADRAAPGGGNNASILRSNLDGSNVTTLASALLSTYSPDDVVLFGDDVYWDNTGSSSEPVPAVGRCAKAGCNDSPDLLPYAGSFGEATGLAVSDAGVFWAGAAPITNSPSVWRIDPSDGGMSGPIVTGLFVAGALQADGDQLDFSAFDWGPVVGRVAQSAPLLQVDAGAVTSAFDELLELSYTFPTPPSFVVDTTTLYFVDGQNGVVGAIPRTGLTDGGTPRVIVAGLQSPMRIATDDTNLYWTAAGQNQSDSATLVYSDGSVMTCPKTGCAPSGPTVLASGINVLSGYLAVDAAYVYFTVHGDWGPPYDGLVMRVPK